MIMPSTITSHDEAGEERLRRETVSMLGASRVRLTLGALVELYLIGSPYVFGGEVADNDIAAAMDSCYPDDGEPMPKMPREEFHRELEGEIARAMDAYNILDESETPPRRTSDIPICSPEGACDIVGMATQSLPSLTWEDALWHMPLIALVHLGLATARRNGGTTRRDLGAADAIEQLKEWRRKAKEGDNG